MTLAFVERLAARARGEHSGKEITTGSEYACIRHRFRCCAFPSWMRHARGDCTGFGAHWPCLSRSRGSRCTAHNLLAVACAAERRYATRRRRCTALRVVLPFGSVLLLCCGTSLSSSGPGDAATVADAGAETSSTTGGSAGVGGAGGRRGAATAAAAGSVELAAPAAARVAPVPRVQGQDARRSSRGGSADGGGAAGILGCRSSRCRGR